MRNRKIPSMFRTAGRLLRWNRRYKEAKGEPMAADVTLATCAGAVNEIRKRTKAGDFNARHLIVRDSWRIQAAQ